MKILFIGFIYLLIALFFGYFLGRLFKIFSQYDETPPNKRTKPAPRYRPTANRDIMKPEINLPTPPMETGTPPKVYGMTRAEKHKQKNR